MDVERIQKINNLASDLMKQGLAQDREEAIFQAEKVFRSKTSEEYNSMKETMRKVETTPEQSEKNETVDLSQDKIKEILEQNTQYLVKKIKEFQDKVESLQGEMISLKTKIAYKNLPTANQIVSNNVKENNSVTEATTPEVNGLGINNNGQVPKNHPRSGDYKDQDVSIEKFFYMGNKHS